MDKIISETPKNSLSPEVIALLACLKCHFHTTSVNAVRDLLRDDLNWSKLIEISIAQGVMPLLYQSLKEIDDVPRSVMMQLQTLNRMNGLNNLSQTKELLRILTQLEKSGIEAIAFKGAVLAASAYGNVSLRQFNDLDILVRRRDFWQAKAVLISQGYQYNFSEEAEIDGFERDLQISLSYKAPEAEMFNARFEPLLLHSNPQRSIDLHWGIPPRRTWNPNHYDRLWEYCQPMTLMGQSIKSFIPEIALIIQSVNIAKEYGWSRSLKQICDVAQVIQAYPDLDWHLTLRLSSELRCEKLFLLGIYITQNLFNISVPDHIVSKFIQIKSLDTQISLFNSLESKTDSTLHQLFYQSRILLGIRNLYLGYTSPLKTLDRSLNRWWLDEALSMTLLYMYFLMRRLLVPNERDHEFLILPQQLFFLYYFVRPIRLLWKHILKNIYESGTKQKQ
ncbi:nucleotidyltransferase family protein [Nodularia sphaerocarpa]|uniref:nucleotidyltransferase domain-containing protein n=1 Tax=Nodularia sphaerocarpa TaxID=137816 RepID=UPI001EFC2C62|nr:nucleotidyltransferase family protein [Nodularia sphaerocarpa]MDB9372554.1 nucleotidyltransferase family protein [Nodularia sphaerocarpa CS-585]MDB9380473.1 nucleotidyltransferase family protein [Nodularia sphaerocarpa CS-585A2]